MHAVTLMRGLLHFNIVCVCVCVICMLLSGKAIKKFEAVFLK